MTAELDYSTPIAALNAVSGPNAAAAAGIAAALLAAAAPYDTAYNASGAVDTAKVAWMALALAEYNAAAHLARYAESLNGGTAAALGSPDYYDPSVILARLTAAVGRAKTYGAAEAASLIQWHASIITSTWAATQGSAPVGGVLPDAYRSAFFYPVPSGGYSTEYIPPWKPQPPKPPPAPYVSPVPAIAVPSVRSLELPDSKTGAPGVAGLIAQATSALAAFAYV